MPELSRFVGIVIAMYYRDHGPAHFHAIYGDYEVTVEIESGRVNGEFPKRALAHVYEWKSYIELNCLRPGRWRDPAVRCRVLIRWSEIYAATHHRGSLHHRPHGLASF